MACYRGVFVTGCYIRRMFVEDGRRCDFIILVRGGGRTGCMYPQGHTGAHALPPDHPILKFRAVEGAQWTRSDEFVLHLGWASFTREGRTEPYRVGVENGFIIFEDSKGNQASFREWQIHDVVAGLDKLGQLPPPMLQEERAQECLRTLLPDLDGEKIKEVVLAVWSSGSGY